MTHLSFLFFTLFSNNGSSIKSMPIITSKSSGSSSVAFIPPAEAFKKPRQILKRGNGSSQSTPNSGQSTPKDGDGRLSSLADRERAYMDARDRIFRSSESSTSWEESRPPNPIHSDAKSNINVRNEESRRR